MTEVAHAERAHALLGASKASQWINCPPSARLSESVPDKRSEYADEGTAAHEYAELILRKKFTLLKEKERRELDKQIKQFQKSNPFYGPEMENAIQDYVEIVIERYHAAKDRSEDAVILLEERLDFSAWVPDGFGTGDVVIISDGWMETIDLKYGKGVPVDAVGNYQMRLYALGALNEYDYLYGIREIRMTIVQPRLDSVSSDTMAAEDLLEWAETVVKPAAALADAGEGEFLAGEHCRWCKVKATCRARADANLEALAYEFKDPALLSNEEIGQVLTVAERLQAWAKDVQQYAYDQALKGERFEGWKLVEGRSNRTITDKDKAIELFELEGLDVDTYLKPRDLLGITELEKRIGKREFTKLLGELIQKPPGRPVLVAETDKRPELNSVDQDFANEDFE